ncbi:hypothetical protein M0811_06104 [Anaeramoeba ignava]|uniref:Uncharacterized protein n=1 Tax=Anaeramoeba ignava TaxID=1746090 RepID=A0A9Q0RDW3_ANAIG|nr:hypothetical protein M0811_06104 [Anaeramoeba ignava]
MKPLKIVGIGDGAIGKTCFYITVVNKKFPDIYIPTVFDNYRYDFNISGKNITLEFWDPTGGEDFDRIRRLYYPETNVFLLFFSITAPYSYENIRQKWVPEIKQYLPNAKMILIGTKSDLRFDKETQEKLKSKNLDFITHEQGIVLAKKICASKYIEISSLTQKGLESVLKEIVHVIYGVVKPKKKDSKCITN